MGGNSSPPKASPVNETGSKKGPSENQPSKARAERHYARSRVATHNVAQPSNIRTIRTSDDHIINMFSDPNECYKTPLLSGYDWCGNQSYIGYQDRRLEEEDDTTFVKRSGNFFWFAWDYMVKLHELLGEMSSGTGRWSQLKRRC